MSGVVIEARDGVGGQICTVVRPLAPTVARLVMLCHGSGLAFAPSSDIGINWPNLREMANYLALRGYAVAQPALWDVTLDIAQWGSTWGNNASTTILNNAVTALRALPGIASTGKIALIGGSMGNVTIANYYRRFSGTVSIAGLLGLIPASELTNKRGLDASPGAFYDEINDALGVTTNAQFTTAKATYDPPAIAPSVAVPWALWTNSDDTTCPPAEAVTLAALVPSARGTTRNMGTGGHDFNNVTGKDVLDWLDTLNWS